MSGFKRKVLTRLKEIENILKVIDKDQKSQYILSFWIQINFSIFQSTFSIKVIKAIFFNLLIKKRSNVVKFNQKIEIRSIS